jgi:ABC-type Fe3+-hydroxamate transport system substrate-binding protein
VFATAEAERMAIRLARLVVALLAACLLASPAMASPPAYTLVDDLGRSLQLTRAPQRIVSLAPHATEMLFEIGLGGQVVAVDPNSDHPQAASLPRLGSWPQPSIEAVLAMRPDLILAWKPGVSPRFLEAMARFSVPVFISAPAALDTVAASMERLAALATDPESGRASVARFRSRLDALRASVSGRVPVRVLVQIWHDPLIVAGDTDLIGDAIRACGGVNVAAGLPGAAPAMGIEQAILARPDLIVALDRPASRQRWQDAGVLQPRGTARFESLDGSLMMRPGPRAIDAAQALCGLIDAGRPPRQTR